jgi:hypothetical protein
MTLEGLGEVFKGDSAERCAGKFPLVSMGGRVNGQACADGEGGPPSARVEIWYLQYIIIWSCFMQANIYLSDKIEKINVVSSNVCCVPVVKCLQPLSCR